MADLGLRYVPCDRPAMTRQELNDSIIKKYKLKLGKVLKIKVRNPDNFGRKEIKRAKIICLHPNFITCASTRNPNVKYTLYYFDLAENIE